jgi:hypothetical protein
VDSLFNSRNHFILNYLVDEKQIDSQSIKISNTLDEKSAQFESTPRYTTDFIVDESKRISANNSPIPNHTKHGKQSTPIV